MIQAKHQMLWQFELWTLSIVNTPLKVGLMSHDLVDKIIKPAREERHRFSDTKLPSSTWFHGTRCRLTFIVLDSAVQMQLQIYELQFFCEIQSQDSKLQNMYRCIPFGVCLEYGWLWYSVQYKAQESHTSYLLRFSRKDDSWWICLASGSDELVTGT